MQPDREDAERDDAAVEVAAHVFLTYPRRTFLFDDVELEYPRRTDVFCGALPQQQ